MWCVCFLLLLLLFKKFVRTSSYNDTATTCYLLKCKRSVLWHAQFLRCSTSMSGAGGKGRRKNRKGQDLFKDDRHKDMIGKAWVNAGFKRSSAELKKVAEELKVNYPQVQGWIDRNVAAGKQQLPPPLFFLPSPPFSFTTLVFFHQKKEENKASLESKAREAFPPPCMSTRMLLGAWCSRQN